MMADGINTPSNLLKASADSYYAQLSPTWQDIGSA